MKKVYLLLALSALISASCSKESFRDSETGNGNDGCTEFSASIEDAISSKTTIEYDGSVYQVKWVANANPSNADQISIIDANENVGIFFVDALTDDSGTKAHFANVSGSVSTPDFHAVFPADIYDGTTGKYILPAVQKYVSGTMANDFPMVASSSSTDLAFANICGIIHMTVTNKTGDAISLSSISIFDDSQAMSGEITIDWAEKSISSISGTAGVTLSCETPVDIASDASETFNIAVPAGTYNNLKIVVSTSDGKMQKFNAKKSVTVKKSQYNNFTIQPSEVCFDYVYGDANCYIAQPGVATTVNVTPFCVENDYSTITPATYAPAPKSAKVLWSEQILADNCSDIIIDDSSIGTGSISVTTPAGRYGNAVVAIYDQAGGTGNILWSYHIWVPEMDPTANVLPYGNLGVLPMYLGATRYPTAAQCADPANPDPNTITDDEAYHGFGFAWGRKDILSLRISKASHVSINSLPLSSGSENFTSNADVDDIITGICENQTTEAVKYARSHPMTAIVSTHPSPNHWEYKDNTPENKANAVNLWGCPDALSGPNDFPKSVYDPCPAGYRVTTATQFGSSDVHQIKNYEIEGTTDKGMIGMYVNYNKTDLSMWDFYPAQIKYYWSYWKETINTQQPYKNVMMAYWKAYFSSYASGYYVQCSTISYTGNNLGNSASSTALWPLRCVVDSYPYQD